MTTGKQFGATTGSLRRLLVVTAENAATLPDVTVEKTTLEQALGDAEVAQNRQDAAKGEKQLATQLLKDALTRARDAGIQLKNAAKFKLGARNEKLVAFQVAPLRKRGKQKTQKLTKKQKAELLKQENESLKKELELLRSKEVPAPAPVA